MLRTFVLVAAMVAFSAALIGVVVDLAVWPTVLVAGVVLAGTLFERRRYGAAKRRPESEEGWQATGEQFIDDASGKPMRVWFNPAGGQRRYVLDESVVPINDIANYSQN